MGEDDKNNVVEGAFGEQKAETSDVFNATTGCMVMLGTDGKISIIPDLEAVFGKDNATIKIGRALTIEELPAFLAEAQLQAIMINVGKLVMANVGPLGATVNALQQLVEQTMGKVGAIENQVYALNLIAGQQGTVELPVEPAEPTDGAEPSPE